MQSINSEISFRQVDTLTLVSPTYKNFKRVSRYLFYLQRLGLQKRSSYWRDFEIPDVNCKKMVSFKTLNPDSYFQRSLNQTEGQCIFDVSSKVSTLYNENTLTLCLDLTMGMRRMNFATGKTFVEEMKEQIEGILVKLFSPMSKSSQSVNMPIFNDLKEIHLNVLLFDEQICKCILFNHSFFSDQAHSITEMIFTEIQQFLQHPPEQPSEDILCHVIQQILSLQQRQEEETCNSILLVTNASFEIHFTLLHPFILLMLQRDIPLHAFLLPIAELKEEPLGKQHNSMSTHNAYQIETISHFTCGDIWFEDTLSYNIFLRTIDLSIPYLTFQSKLYHNDYSCLSDPPSIEAYHSIHLVMEKFHTCLDTFLQSCIHDGFELDTISILNKSIFTLSLILPLSFHYHLKMVIHTNDWSNKLPLFYVEMNLIQKSTKIYQLDVVTSIANNILSFLKFRFNSNPLSFHLPNYEIFDYILPANSPIEMTHCFDLFFICLQSYTSSSLTVLDRWLSPYRAITRTRMIQWIDSIFSSLHYHRLSFHSNQEAYPIFVLNEDNIFYILQPYVKEQQFIVHCTLRIIMHTTEDINDTMIQQILQDELNRIKQVLNELKQRDYQVKCIDPSTRYELSHCTTYNTSLMNRIIHVQEHNNNPVLCPCIPSSYKNTITQVLHTYEKTHDFVLQQAYAKNIIEWLRVNDFHICKYHEDSTLSSIYLTKKDQNDEYMILYECNDEHTTIKLLSFSFIDYSLKLPVTPLNSILQIQKDRQQVYQGPKENIRKSITKDTVSLTELSTLFQHEIAYNYAVFHSLSSFYCWSANTEPSSLIDDSELTQEIGMLLLHRAIHLSQHFYTFIPSNHLSTSPFTQDLSSLSSSSSKFKISIRRNKCDLISNESNFYLYNLLLYNLHILYHVLPSSVVSTLREIASSSLDFSYINTSQAFFTVCDASGNKLSSRDTQFYLFIVFLHNFSNSSPSSGQQFVKLDYFFLSPSFFNCNTLINASEDRERGEIPQETVIQDLFKSCYFYTLYHSIVVRHVINGTELHRFLTSDNCSSFSIDIDVSPLLQALPYLSSKQLLDLDNDVINSLACLPCAFCEEYFLVCCPSFPCFIHISLHHPYHEQCHDRSFYFSNQTSTSFVSLLKDCQNNHCKTVSLCVTAYCPRQKIELPSNEGVKIVVEENNYDEEIKRYSETSQYYTRIFERMKSYVNNEDMNITAMKRVVNTFTSVIASYSLEVTEKHLLENLSYIEKVYDLLGNMNITHSVCVRKHPPSSTPSEAVYPIFTSSFAVDCTNVPIKPQPIQLNGRSFLKIKSFFLYVKEKPINEMEVSKQPNHSKLQDDRLLYENYGLDRFYLPYICIVSHNSIMNEFYFRVHDPNKVIQNDPFILQSINIDPTASDIRKRYEVLNQFLNTIQDQCELSLFEAKNKNRLDEIIKSKIMTRETIVDESRYSSIQFKKHLHSLYDDKLFFPFNSICTLFETSLVLDNKLVDHLFDEIEKKFSQQIIHQLFAFPNHTYKYPEFYFLCFILPPYKHSILVLTVIPKKEEDHTCDHMSNSKTWELLLKCWGWDQIVLKNRNPLVHYIEKLTLQYKLNSIYNQYIQMDKLPNNMIETDIDVLRWIQDSTIHNHDSFTITLHAICTPSVFLCLFFKAMKESKIYPVMANEEKEKNEEIIIPISSHQCPNEMSETLYIGKHFYFLYSKNNSSKDMVLIEVSLSQSTTINDKKTTTTITSLTHTCSRYDQDNLIEENVYKHIPKSLHGDLGDKLYDGLELSIHFWFIAEKNEYEHEHNNEHDNEHDLSASCRATLSTLARQARIETFIDFHLLSLPDSSFSQLSTSKVPSILSSYTKYVIAYNRRKEVNIMTDLLKDLHVKDGVQRYSIYQILPKAALRYIADTSYDWIKEGIPQDTVLNPLEEPVPFTIKEETRMYLRSYHAYMHNGKEWEVYIANTMEPILTNRIECFKTDGISQLLQLFDKKTDFASGIVFISFSDVPQVSSDTESDGEDVEDSDEQIDQTDQVEQVDQTNQTEQSEQTDHMDHIQPSCCTITRYQQVLNEYTHTPYILLFISHRYIHCISRGVDSSIVKSFTERIESVINLLIIAHTIRNGILMQQSGRTLFLQNLEIPQVCFNRIVPSINVSSYPDLNIYQSIRTLRLPTQLLHINKTEQSLSNTAKKVSEKVIQLGSEMAKEVNELQKRQQNYEYLIRELSLNQNDIQKFHQSIIQDFTLVHKCYNLSIPINTNDDKPIEETSTPFFVNRTARKNSSNFLSLFSHRKISRGDTSISNSSTTHSFATHGSDSGIIEGSRHDLRNSYESSQANTSSLSIHLDSSNLSQSSKTTNSLHSLLLYIQDRIPILIPSSKAIVTRNEKDTDPWMVIVHSQDSFIFYYLSLRSYGKSVFINIYSNCNPSQFRFPFLMLYNEYYNSLYFRHIQDLILSHSLYTLPDNEINTLDTKLLKPVTHDKCSFCESFKLTQSSTPPIEQTYTILYRNAEELGVKLHGDKTKNILAYAIIHYPTTEKHSYPAGMILNDIQGNTMELIMNKEEKEIKNEHMIYLDIEGIEFASLFFIPSTLKFEFFIQFYPSVAHTALLYDKVHEIIQAWISSFNQSFTKLFISSFSCLPYIDISHNHIDSSLFATKVQPLLLFYKNHSMFNRLKTKLDSQCRFIADLSKENHYVYTLNMNTFRYLILLEYIESKSQTQMDIIDTKYGMNHDMKVIDQIVDLVSRIAYKEVFGFN